MYRPPPGPPPDSSPGPATGRARAGPADAGSLAFGLVLLALGGWFFADVTLGLAMPRVRLSELWPVILVGLGAWILLASLRRR